MLIPSRLTPAEPETPSLSRRVNANSQLRLISRLMLDKLIKKGEC